MLFSLICHDVEDGLNCDNKRARPISSFLGAKTCVLPDRYSAMTRRNPLVPS